MLSLLGGLLFFQIALISPNASPNGVDLLPADIAAWHAAAAPEKFSVAQLNAFATADNAAVLDELGFFGAQRRQYTGGKDIVTVEAIRMKDPSAAYGAFTWFRQTGWREETNSSHDPRAFQAAVGATDAVLQRNSYVVHISGVAATHQQLEAAAAALPSLENEPLPALASHLPASGLVGGSVKYAYGPQLFDRVVPGLPAMAMGFHLGAEVVAGEYRLPGKSPMTLVLVEYPTPQIARSLEKNLTSQNLNGAHVKRVGPLLAIVPGGASDADAARLIDQVHYEMAGMWDEKVSKIKEPSFAQMIISIFELCGILLVFCVLSGAAYGGIRVLTRSKNPGYAFEGDADFISLKING